MAKRLGAKKTLGPILLENSKFNFADTLACRQNAQPVDSGTVWRAEATEDEKERARRFRDMLADLSPDVDEIYRKLMAKAPIEMPVISDTEINSRIGPILEEYGFNLTDLNLRRRSHAVEQRNERKILEELMVLDVDFTQDNELQEFRQTLETVLSGTRMNEGWNAYCIPVLNKQHLVGAACISPVADWEKIVVKEEQEKLAGPMFRAYSGLVEAASIKSDFARCRVVYFRCGRDQEANRWAQNVNERSHLRPTGSNRSSERDNGPLILVDGETVVATLPHDAGNRVLSATLAVDEIDSDAANVLGNQFLPDVGAFAAVANKERSYRHFCS